MKLEFNIFKNIPITGKKYGSTGVAAYPVFLFCGGSKLKIMKYIVVNIGCIECGVSSKKRRDGENFLIEYPKF